MKTFNEMNFILRKRITELKGEMSIAELARRSNVPRTTISGILASSNRCLNLYSVYRLAEYFNVSIDYLIGRKDFD